jgi:hypothetical protein
MPPSDALEELVIIVLAAGIDPVGFELQDEELLDDDIHERQGLSAAEAEVELLVGSQGS